MFKLLLEMDASQQLPAVVFNLARKGCNFRVLKMVKRLKAAMTETRGKSFEEVVQMREDLQTQVKALQKDIDDLEVRPHLMRACSCSCFGYCVHVRVLACSVLGSLPRFQFCHK